MFANIYIQFRYAYMYRYIHRYIYIYIYILRYVEEKLKIHQIESAELMGGGGGYFYELLMALYLF